MELAASADWVWTCGDPWQYISCLPGPSAFADPFKFSVEDAQSSQWLGAGRGKKPMEPEAERRVTQPKLPAKKPKKTGICWLFNSVPSGCPYGRGCIFIHHCNNCGAVNTTGWCVPFLRNRLVTEGGATKEHKLRSFLPVHDVVYLSLKVYMASWSDIYACKVIPANRRCEKKQVAWWVGFSKSEVCWVGLNRCRSSLL